MKAFNHVNAHTIDEAVRLLRNGKGLVRPIAGGTDLLGILKDRVLPTYPETVVNLKTIPDLDCIREDDKGVRIGALTRLADIVESPIVLKNCKLLGDAARSVATPQIRNIATIGGNIGQEVRCWYYRYPHQIGGRILCARKQECQSLTFPADVTDKSAGPGCSAIMGENRYHSIFGAQKVGQTPCSIDCPAATDIPAYLSKIREGDLDGAARLLLDANPIPAITGRVCPQLCTERCNRGDYDEAVSIRNIERFVGDYILEQSDKLLDVSAPRTGKRVGVVGSGPAGLCAAYFLKKSGHEVVVFDRMKEAGGMLAHSIPAFRLPLEKVRSVIDAFKRMGITFRLGTEIGKDIALAALKKEFDVLFLATGAWVSPVLGIEGETSALQGLEFLKRAKQGVNEVSGKKVMVIGGGNVAVDVAVTALRQGAGEVLLACLESREEMPALKHEIENAIEEGVKVMPSWGPSRIITEGGAVKGIELVQCTAVFDACGNFAPVCDNSIRQPIETEQVIMAVGQRPDLSFINEDVEIKLDQCLVSVNRESYETSVPGIFAGGELTSGPAIVAQAVAAGRKAAFAIDRFLGKSVRKKKANASCDSGLLTFDSTYLRPTSPVSAPVRSIQERNLHEEDCAGVNSNEARLEANRCFNCGCVAISASDIAPVLVALNAAIKTTQRTITADKFFSSNDAGPDHRAHDELLTEIVIPRLSNNCRCEFKKHRVRSSLDFPMVSLATVFTMDKDGGTIKDARIVLGAVAPWPVRVVSAEEFLKGKTPGKEVAEQAAALAVEKAVPLSGNRYKVEIVKALIQRSIMSAA